MAVDYSKLAFPKSRVKALDKWDEQRAKEKHLENEDAKVRHRSGGQCEIREVFKLRPNGRHSWARCLRPGQDIHHLLGGIGRRNRGKSALAEYKVYACRKCHDLITKNILRPTTADHDASTVRYWRAK